MDRETELVLIARLGDKDPDAFDAVHAAFNARLFNFLGRLCRRRDLAEDLLEETWLRLVAHAGRLEPDTRLGPWLFTVARHLHVSYCRSRAIEDSRGPNLLGLWPYHPAGASPFEEAARNELERRIERALAALPAQSREVLLLVGVQGLEPSEAAIVCGVTPEAVRQRLSRARAMLLRALDTGEQRIPVTDTQARVVCDEATAAGLRSLVHAVYDRGARAAVRAGCTAIEHGTFVSDRTLKLMAERGTWFDPSLLVWHNSLDNRAAFGMTEESIATMREAIGRTADVLRRARALGVRTVFGTDAVAGAHGRNAEEFVYRVREAREKPSDVLISATSGAAASLGLGSRLGAIAAGYEADLVATDGNPLDDVTAVRRVVFVMRDGRVVHKEP